MYDWSHLFPPGMLPGIPDPKPARPLRTAEELADSLLRWRCAEYEPGFQCHFCDDCKPSRLCSLCTDLSETAKLLKALSEQPEPKLCMHGRPHKECGPCGPREPGSQD